MGTTKQTDRKERSSMIDYDYDEVCVMCGIDNETEYKKCVLCNRHYQKYKQGILYDYIIENEIIRI